MSEEHRQSARPIASRIESSVARLLTGHMGFVMPEHQSTAISDLKAAWHSYGVLSHRQDDVMEIRRYQFTLQIVRENARLFPAAICANLIEDLESRGCAEIDSILATTAEIPTTVNFDPSLPLTVAAQLRPRNDSRSARPILP